MGLLQLNSSRFLKRKKVSGGSIFLKFYCRFEGVNNSTNFVDDYGATITNTGSPIISTTQFYSGSSSGFFDNSYISFPSIDFGAGDFFISCFIFPTQNWNDYSGIFGQGNGGGSWGCASFAGTLALWTDGGSVLSFNSNPPINQWTKIEMSRVSGIMTLKMNDVIKNTRTDTNNYSRSGQVFTIGNSFINFYNKRMSGYIDEFKIFY